MNYKRRKVQSTPMEITPCLSNTTDTSLFDDFDLSLLEFDIDFDEGDRFGATSEDISSSSSTSQDDSPQTDTDSVNGDDGNTLTILQEPIFIVIDASSHRKPHPKRKKYMGIRCRENFARFPMVLKKDIRRQYPHMILNILNSGDALLVFRFYRQYCLPSCSCTKTGLAAPTVDMTLLNKLQAASHIPSTAQLTQPPLLCKTLPNNMLWACRDQIAFYYACYLESSPDTINQWQNCYIKRSDRSHPSRSEIVFETISRGTKVFSINDALLQQYQYEAECQNALIQPPLYEDIYAMPGFFPGIVERIQRKRLEQPFAFENVLRTSLFVDERNFITQMKIVSTLRTITLTTVE